MVRCGTINVDESRETGEKGSSCVRVPESTGCSPGELSGCTEQTFDTFVLKGTIFVQQNSKIPEGRTVLSKEGMRFVPKSTDEVANLITIEVVG